MSSYSDIIREKFKLLGGDLRYQWLDNHLRDFDKAAPSRPVTPLVGGLGTRTVVADFDQADCSSITYNEWGDDAFQDRSSPLDDVFHKRTPDVHGRLIFLSTVTGVHQNIRHKLQNRPVRFKNGRDPNRTVVALGTKTLPGHYHVRPTLKMLATIAKSTLPDPELLLRYLDDNAHLTSRSCLWGTPDLNCGRTPTRWQEFQVCVDGANQFFVALDQEKNGDPWTLLILAIEDNCMGLDFHDDATSDEQPLQAFTSTPSETFMTLLKSLSPDDQTKIRTNPLLLSSLYSRPFASAFAAHIELYCRNWSISYEPYARSSAVYGYTIHREAVRRLSRTYATHLRYLRHTLDGLNSSLIEGGDIAQQRILNPLIRDYERFAREIQLLKNDCDQFLEQQISKLALQDARAQMREARDIKRLSYLAFVFVPLSLTSSFFGMNIKELDSGQTPVWVFVVTALAILVMSLAVTWFTKAWSSLSLFINETSRYTDHMGAATVLSAMESTLTKSHLPQVALSGENATVSRNPLRNIFRRNNRLRPGGIISTPIAP